MIPKLPRKLLRWMCRPDLVDEIEGDLSEEFARRRDERGIRYAQWMYWIDVITFARPEILRKSTSNFIHTAMLRNYLVMSFRSMSKKPLFSLINVFGLSSGLACVIVIAGYVLFMLSYDRQYEKPEDIYRVTMQWINDGVQQHSAMAVPTVAGAIAEGLHGVKNVVRVFPYSGLVSKDGIDKVRETRFCYADSGFFKLFNLKGQRGVLSSSLTAPFSVVLTEEMAIKYYGTADVVGQELFFEDERGTYRFNITAVIDNIPQNTHFNPDFIASMTTLDRTMTWYNNWHYPPMFAYIRAAEGYDAGTLQTALNAKVRKSQPPYIKENERSYFIQPVTDIHLHSNLANEWQSNSNIVYVNVLIVVAAFILFLACINYINLATARGSERAREVGVRKVMGAVRNQLVGQFLGESFVTTMIALIVSVAMAEGAMRLYLDDLVGKQLSVFEIFSTTHLVWAMGGLMLLTLISGMYPAFFLSHFRPVSMLKGGSTKSGAGLTLRRSLVAFQFVISSLLIVGMIIIQRQAEFMREKKLGFDNEQVVNIRLFDRHAGRNFRTLKDQLLRESVVKEVAVTSTFPMKEGFHAWPVTPEGHAAEDRMTMKSMSGDEDVLNALNLQLISGRNFTRDNPADSAQAFILNEAAVKSLGWTDPVGKDFELTYFADRGANWRKGKVIGVVKDFHFESLYNTIDPLVIFINTQHYYCDYLVVKLAPGNINESMRVLENNWNKFNPNKPFEYSFADEDLGNLYAEETRLSSMFSSFTMLSIMVSCLGLFGLSAYTMSQRLKEIGIRKVLGASVGDLFTLLSREYLVLIMLAQVIAAPLAWWFASQWLSGFAYQVGISMTAFLITWAAAIGFGILSISIHVFRAVRANPAATLRIE